MYKSYHYISLLVYFWDFQENNYDTVRDVVFVQKSTEKSIDGVLLSRENTVLGLP